jgi:hypothetical protein
MSNKSRKQNRGANVMMRGWRYEYRRIQAAKDRVEWQMSKEHRRLRFQGNEAQMRWGRTGSATNERAEVSEDEKGEVE